MFYEMQSCKFSKTRKKGKAKMIRLGGVKFLTKNYKTTQHSDPDLPQMRTRCVLGGGKGTFGFDPHKIGNKSLQSGAAMGLLLKRRSSDEVMILGRWKTKLFWTTSDPKW